MMYTTPIYAIVVSLLVGQLLFPWRRKRNEQIWRRTDTEKVAKVAAGDLRQRRTGKFGALLIVMLRVMKKMTPLQ